MIIPTNPDQPWDPGPLLDRISHDCEHLKGFPHCMGSAALGAENCTCTDGLTSTQHLAAEQSALMAYQRRKGRMCEDCFFRSTDCETEHERRLLAGKPGPARCHVFMPLFGIGGVAQRDSFAPRDERLYPICKGWERARKRAEVEQGKGERSEAVSHIKITFKFKSGEVRNFPHEGRSGGSYTKTLTYEGAFAVVTNEWGVRTAFPAADIAEVEERPVRW